MSRKQRPRSPGSASAGDSRSGQPGGPTAGSRAALPPVPRRGRSRGLILGVLGFTGGLGLALLALFLAVGSPGEKRAEAPSPRNGLPAELRADPEVLKAMEALRSGSVEEAIRLFEAVHRRHPRFAEPLVEIVRIHLERRDLPLAEAAARRATLALPESAACHIALGEVLEQQKRRDEAERAFLRAAELAPRDPEPWYQLGRIAAGRGHYQLATKHYRKALEIEPGYPPAAHYLASSLREEGDYAEAVGLLHAALEHEPQNDTLRCNLAHTYLRMGDAASAEREFRKALPHASEKAETYYFLGRALEQQGKDQEAVQALRRALDWDPVLPMAWYTLAQVEKRIGRQEPSRQALAEFEKATALRMRVKDLASKVQKNPGDVRLLVEYGNALLDGDRPEEALGPLRRASSLAPLDEAIAARVDAAEKQAVAKRTRQDGLR